MNKLLMYLILYSIQNLLLCYLSSLFKIYSLTNITWIKEKFDFQAVRGSGFLSEEQIMSLVKQMAPQIKLDQIISKQKVKALIAMIDI